MYMSDPNRSGVTSEKLDFPLEKIWIYEPSQPPNPAWPEPGKELHRIDFDYAFQPVVSQGRVYFGSSADDTLRALDAVTGKLVWRFTAGGPIRFAPAVAYGKAYVASDDGWLYCLDARSGELVWTFQGAPGDDRMLGNGRMISRWPLRTGVLVANHVAYITAGMWPNQGVYVYALDAETGRELWCNDSSGSMYVAFPHSLASGFGGVAPQGYLAASNDILLVPTGRHTPAAYDRNTGRLLHCPQSGANGGAWITIVGDLYFNPGHKPRMWADYQIGEAEPWFYDNVVGYSLASRESVLTLNNKHRVLGTDEMLYAVGGGKIQAIDMSAWREKKRKLDESDKWTPSNAHSSLHGKAYNHAAEVILNECVKWSAPHSHAYCLVLAGRTLLAGGRNSITAFDISSGQQTWRSTVEGQVRGIAIAGDRLVAATDKGAMVCFGGGAPTGVSAKCVKESPAAVTVSEKERQTAADIVEKAGVSSGYALVIGEPDSRLATALAAQTDLHVIGALRGTSDVAEDRERLLGSNLYGSRVVVHGLSDLSRLPYAPYFANLVVVSGDVRGIFGEDLYRVLRPCGGVLYFSGIDPEQAEKLIHEAKIPPEEFSRGSRMVTRGALPGAGEWRYQWADGGRTVIMSARLSRLPKSTCSTKSTLIVLQGSEARICMPNPRP